MLFQTVFRMTALKNVKQSIKENGGVIVGIQLLNLDAAVGYLQFWDSLVANVTVGTTVPKWTIPIAASAAVYLGAEDVRDDLGLQAFQTGIVVADTTAFDGSGAAPTNGLVLSVQYG